MLWRAYYDNGTTSDSEWDIRKVPTEGVIVMVQKDDAPGDPYAVGRELLFDRDYYCWDVKQGRWFGCDLYGMNDYLRREGWKKVLFGRWTERSNYKSLLLKAQGDPDFPVKSALQAGEERLREIA